MGLFHRKSKFEQLTEALEGQTMLKNAARSTLRSALSPQPRDDPFGAGSGGHAPSHQARSVLGSAKPGLVAAGGAAVGITAASAAISALRRHNSAGD